MTDLQKEFEATGYTSWINANLYPDGKIYTQEYTQWLEKQVIAFRSKEWISVKDRLPENTVEKDYLITDGYNILMAFRNHDMWFVHGEYCHTKITHWMPLPEPPKQ